VYALYSPMSMLDYTIEPEIECPQIDMNDVAFV
jgi:hypothetical protein